MAEKQCVLCKIAKGEIPSYAVYKDKDYLAVLDIFPNIKGQTLVITRKHMASYAFDLNDKELADLAKISKRVAKMLEKRLGVARVHLVLEGTGINHLHAKLYPAIGLKSKKFKGFTIKGGAYFNRYPGYVTTIMGPKASDTRLRQVYKKLREK